MTRTVAKVIYKGVYRVVHDDSVKYNPYTIYKEWHEAGKHGVVNRSKKLISYADLASCMYHITEDIVNE